MKSPFTGFWFWGVLLSIFVVIILWEEKLEKAVSETYQRHRMVLENVNWSQVEKGFEHARLYADSINMDDNHNNMDATTVKVIFFKEDIATWTGRLISERGLKNPFEAKFWGDVKAWNVDNERMKSDEIRYYFNRKEMHTQKPVTIWKDDTIITGLGMSYNVESKEARIFQQVKIQVWDHNASDTADPEVNDAKSLAKLAGLPIAPPPSELLFRPLTDLSQQDDQITTAAALIATDSVATFPIEELSP